MARVGQSGVPVRLRGARLPENLGLEIRAGLHTGEIEIMDNDIGGAAVHAAARIEEAAGAREVFVSRTVVDLMAGSDGVSFADLGEYSLKGLSGNWRLFRAQI